jgi:cell division septal protein FtsQ
MSLPDRKENEVRRMLDGTHPQVPADLGARAAERGERLLRRNVVVRRVMWVLLVAVVVAFVVWMSVAQPWVMPPSEVTPPLEGF